MLWWLHNFATFNTFHNRNSRFLFELIWIYSEIQISLNLGFFNLPRTQTMSGFPSLVKFYSFTLAFSNALVFFEPIFLSLAGLKYRDCTVWTCIVLLFFKPCLHRGFLSGNLMQGLHQVSNMLETSVISPRQNCRWFTCAVLKLQLRAWWKLRQHARQKWYVLTGLYYVMQLTKWDEYWTKDIKWYIKLHII